MCYEIALQLQCCGWSIGAWSSEPVPLGMPQGTLLCRTEHDKLVSCILISRFVIIVLQGLRSRLCYVRIVHTIILSFWALYLSNWVHCPPWESGLLRLSASLVFANKNPVVVSVLHGACSTYRTTTVGGSLGSCVDEECSKLCELV